ncbi:MAG: response regulator [Anaerolineae bacterium]|nr:response regulator [Anaerolineae bacterium]
MTIVDKHETEPQSMQHDRELVILQSASAAIMSSLDLEHVLDAVIGEMVNLLDVEACTIFDWKPDDNAITPLAVHRPSDWTATPEPSPAMVKLTEFPITRRVLTDKRATQLTCTDAANLSQTHAAQQNTQTLLMLPLIFQDRVIGLVDSMDRRSERIFSAKEMAMAKLLANHAAIAIENARLHAETAQRTQQLALIQKLDRAITVSLRISDVYHAFANHVARVLSYDHMSITILERNELRVSYVNNNALDITAFPVGVQLPLLSSAVGWVINQRQPLLRHNIAIDSHFAEDEQLVKDQIKAQMIIPLRIKGQIIGTWNIGSRQIGNYSPDDLALSQTVADQLAVAIANARSYEQARQEIVVRKRAEAMLEEERSMLAQRVAEQTADLRAANVELAKIARLKDEFLANVSHELRTPLTAILGLCEMLDMGIYGPLNEKQTHSVHNIEESGNHLLDLINDILDLSKVEAHELELQIEPVHIDSVCQASLKLVKQMAYKKQLKVSLVLDSAIDTINADERRLKQILVNLLSNAVKFTLPDGTVGLEVCKNPEREQIDFIVWDTGIGIAPEHQQQLFQPFMQLDNRLSRQHSGTGLGLSLVYRLAHLHHGEVTLESEVGRGSRFVVSLPLQSPVTSDYVSRDTIRLEKLSDSLVPINKDETASDPLILLAEDDPKVSALMVDFLTRQGYRLVVANTGREALTKAISERPALILMDIQMPELDGLTAIRQARETPELRDIPIVALTARAMSNDRDKCLEAGATDYLSKPVSLAELINMLKVQLAASRKVVDG